MARVDGLDVLRGWAIVLMIVYHLFYNLDYFAYINIDMDHEMHWRIFRYIIMTLFLISVGISLQLSHLHGINWRKVTKRTLILGLVSLLVTISTYIQFPKTWVYFGILHFILVASWLGLPFLSRPMISLVGAILIFIGYGLGWMHMHWLFSILHTPLNLPLKYTVDLVPLFPWFGIVLIGIAVASLKMHYLIFNNVFFRLQNRLNKILALLGKNALIVYLIHLPILFAIFMIVDKL